jgi:DNA-binding MarR family transcriptional regulator
MASLPAADADPSIPELMRAAGRTYRQASGARLAAGGFDDLPRSGGILVVYLANGEESIEEMIRGVGVSKQAFSQLADTLVLRGFVTRDVNPQDRRRMTLALTDRGRAAAEAIFAATKAVDEELGRRLSAAEMAGLRHSLAVLGEIGEIGEPPPSRV